MAEEQMEESSPATPIDSRTSFFARIVLWAIGGFGSLLLAFMKIHGDLDLEEKKFQAGLITSTLDASQADERICRLKFIVDSGLVEHEKLKQWMDAHREELSNPECKGPVPQLRSYYTFQTAAVSANAVPVNFFSGPGVNLYLCPSGVTKIGDQILTSIRQAILRSGNFGQVEIEMVSSPGINTFDRDSPATAYILLPSLDQWWQAPSQLQKILEGANIKDVKVVKGGVPLNAPDISVVVCPPK